MCLWLCFVCMFIFCLDFTLLVLCSFFQLWSVTLHHLFFLAICICVSMRNEDETRIRVVNLLKWTLTWVDAMVIFCFGFIFFWGCQPPPQLRDFKGDIKVSLRQKNWIQTPTQTQKDFLNDSFNNSHETKKNSILQRFKQLCFWHCYYLEVKSSMDETSIQTWVDKLLF